MIDLGAINPYKVMLVDDSPMIRSFLRGALLEDENITIVAEADNGIVAIEKVKIVDPDVILLDVEMPGMDGLTALPELLASSPRSRIIMVSTLTKSNAAVAIQALARGASDYLEKPTADTNKEIFKTILINKVKSLAKSSRQSVRGSMHIDPIKPKIEDEKAKVEDQPQTELPSPPPPERDAKEDVQVFVLNEPPQERKLAKIDALAIGSSTGGPQALITFFERLGDKLLDIPIFITQHMPPTFTTFLASSIDKISSHDCVEGEDGMLVEAGKIYLAPGDYHMEIISKGTEKFIALNQREPENFCRPSVNPMFKSLADMYGKNLCVLMLTGMGSDGLDGTKYTKEHGATIIIQDKETSVVWGMPGAVAKENLQDYMLPLNLLADKIIKICEGQ